MSQLATTPAEVPREHPPARSAGSWSANLLLGMAVVLLLLTLVAGSVYYRFHQQHLAALADIEAEVARIQAAGEPITPQDFTAFHCVPDGVTDTTPLWLEAIALAVHKKGPPAAGIPYVGQGDIGKLRPELSDSLLPAAEAYLASYEDAVAATRRAADAEGECRYPIDFSQGLNATTLDHAQNSRQLSRLLSLRARVAAVRGNVEQAIESIELLLALGSSLEREPFMPSQLVRNVVMGVAIYHVGYLVREANLTDEQLARLQDDLQALHFQESRKLAILGERGRGFHAFHQLSTAPANAAGAGKLERPVDCLFYLEMMEQMLAAADNPAPEAMQRHRQVQAQISAKLQSMNLLERAGLALSAQVMPAVDQLFAEAGRVDAERDSAVAGLAFRRFQLRHGRPPASLAELTPEFLPAVPRDPFQAGAPLIFVVTDQQFAIYSVGQNGKDDQALLADPDTPHDRGIVAPLSLPMRAPESNSTTTGKE